MSDPGRTHPCAASEFVHIPAGGAVLDGMLELPRRGMPIVLFAHGSGSGRLSPRNNFVARELRAMGLGTLLIDLLTQEEDRTYEKRFDIDLLTERLAEAARWLGSHDGTRRQPIGLFGASTGAAAALNVAATLPQQIAAVVSRGGRPDLADTGHLAQVRAPTLLIIGGADTEVIALNRSAYRRLNCEKELTLVHGATHLFEEPGALEQVAELAVHWFVRHVRPPHQGDAR